MRTVDQIQYTRSNVYNANIYQQNGRNKPRTGESYQTNKNQETQRHIERNSKEK